MIRHRYIHKICISAMIAAVILTALFMQGESLGIQPVSSSPEYESRLFDDSRYIPLTCRLMTGIHFLKLLPRKLTFNVMLS